MLFIHIHLQLHGYAEHIDLLPSALKSCPSCILRISHPVDKYPSLIFQQYSTHFYWALPRAAVLKLAQTYLPQCKKCLQTVIGSQSRLGFSGNHSQIKTDHLLKQLSVLCTTGEPCRCSGSRSYLEWPTLHTQPPAPPLAVLPLSLKPVAIIEDLRRNRPKPISPRRRPSPKARMQDPGEANRA